MKIACACVLAIACKEKKHTTASVPWVVAASAAAQKLDRTVDLAPAPLTARVDATWACAPSSGRVECTRVYDAHTDWRMTWRLENEPSIKPDATLIKEEDLGPSRPHDEGQWRYTIERADINGYHGLFNSIGGRGEPSIVFIGWHGDAGDRTKLTITAYGAAPAVVDAMAVMMTTAPK